MSDSGQEIEAKFYVQDLDKLKMQLEGLGARLIQERVLETNIRFDSPDASLRAEGRVLRLRQDTDARLTYKSASKNEQGVLSRDEIEFVVEDFGKAKRFLEALGYQKLVYYEKYRTTYALQPLEGFLHVMLDELPYGNFVEIEGETVDAIRALASQLNLNWEAAVATSYNALFDRSRKALHLSVQDLSFADFKDIYVDAIHLGVRAADV
jgi:adenylate cyclase, class 2